VACRASQLRSFKAGAVQPAVLHHLQHFTTLTSLTTGTLGDEYGDEPSTT
jgi:hypothetical protein